MSFLDCLLQIITISNLITIRIRSNLYAGLVGATAFLGVDKDHKKVKIPEDITSSNDE